MVEPLIQHPAVDRATSAALIVEQDRSVVSLSTWVADAAVEATRTGRVLQVVTPVHSRITYPLELLLRDAVGQWVLREDPERFRDGITGVSLRWDGQRFVVDSGGLRRAHDQPQPDFGDLEVQISTLHPAAGSVQLGASTEIAVQLLTGGAPAGWGIAEPVTQPWLPSEIFAQFHQRDPVATQFVVVGSGVLGQLWVQRVDTGVLERIRLSGPPLAVVSQDVIEGLAEAIAGTARVMIVAVQLGRLNGLRTSQPMPPALPYGILLGDQVITERGVTHAQAAPATQVRLLGRGTGQACWCHLQGGDHAPFEQLTAVLRHFGLDATAR